MIIAYDLTDAVLAIARRLQATAGRFESRYSSPAWVAEIRDPDGTRVQGQGPTASQAIEQLGRKLLRQKPDERPR